MRTETALGEGHVSLPSVSAMLAREVLGELDGHRVVVVGTGESAELAAQALAEAGGHLIFVASRHRERAQELAHRFPGAEHVALDDLAKVVLDADVLVASTASPHLLVDASRMAEMQAARRQRPLLLIDLAVAARHRPGLRRDRRDHALRHR